MHRPALLPILRDVLRREDVADDDNFFSLGIDSIQAVSLLHRIRNELGLTVDLADIWRHPSVRALSAALATASAARARTPVAPIGSREHHPVSPVQRGLYVMDRMARGEDSSTVPSLIAFDTDLDPGVAATAFHEVLRRHEPLRTVFRFVDEAPVQIVRPAESVKGAFAFTDLGAAPDTDGALRNLYRSAAREPFDLASGPLVRFHLVRIAPSRCVGLLTLHHIISDDFSAAAIENDFRHFYDTAAGRLAIAGDAPPPPPLEFQYKDYVLWLEDWIHGPDGRRALAHWTGALAGFRPAATKGRRSASFAARRHDAILPPEAVSALFQCSADLEVTLFVLLLGCIKTLLYLETGHGHGAVGVAVTTRDAVPLTGQIGPFVNTLPILSRISPATTFRRLVAEVDDARLAALEHKLLPIETLSEVLCAGAPLFDVGFTLQKRPASSDLERQLAEARGSSDPLGVGLLFIAFESPDELSIRIRYQTARFDPEKIECLRDRFVHVIRTVCADVDAPLGELFGTTGPEDAFSLELNLR